MAEARIAVAEPRVMSIDDIESPDTWEQELKSWRISLAKRYYKTRNMIYNGTWPSPLSNLRIVFLLSFFLMLVEPRFANPVNTFLWNINDSLFIPKGFPKSIQAFITSCIFGVFFFMLLMFVRQSLLRVLLGYRGWMYENPRSHTMATKLWCATVKLISGYKPSLYSCQRSLPRLPVPPLKDTLYRLYQSLKPLCTEEELEEIKQQGKKFKDTLGPKLQKLLFLKSWVSQNYVSDWWVKYAYLRSRSPLPNNSNFYICDECYWIPTNDPISRAANVIYGMLLCKRQIDREELPPLVVRSTVPICMAQYEHVFSSVRIPGEDMDRLAYCEDSKHIVINVSGLYYKLDICDDKNQYLSPKTLEEQLQWIVKDARAQTECVSEVEKSIAALTSLKRSDWAVTRKSCLSRGVNKESRRIIEKSIFMVSFVDYIPQNLTENAKFLLHGDGRCFWFDKSLNLLFFGNSKAGLNCEHTVADAPVMAHIWEFALSREVVERIYDEEGHCMPLSREFKQGKIKKPYRLLWEITPKLEEHIKKAMIHSKKANEDLDLVVVDHDTWGKGAIKNCRVSPDAFIQLALQFAYYKEAKKFVQTYEASMTRLYLCGRTETVRSCTEEARDFVLAMVTNDTSKEEKAKLLHRAAQKHQDLYKDAMNGKGIDRHLFALYVACKGLGYESEFLHKIITRPWTLSTSQTPPNQLTSLPDTNLKIFDDKISAGGGFGPVSDDGYGVSYLVPTDNRIFFHVSSKYSCSKTNSEDFIKRIFESMEEMLSLFETS